MERLFYHCEVPRISQRVANVRYYAANRAAEQERVRTRQAETLAFLRQLRARPCASCGGRFESHQMDFDHRDPAAKAFRLTAGAAMLMGRQRLLAEAAKCDIVCANCHRIRTWRAHADRVASHVASISVAHSTARKRETWRAQAAILDALRAVPCMDCGLKAPPCAMDFDHRESSEKADGVTGLVGRAGISRILAEAAKCDIVCANCHRARTFRRRADRSSERE